MAKNLDGLVTVGVASTLEPSGTNIVLTVGENVRGSYRLVNNDSDRDLIDPLLLENGMIIYHDENSEYQTYTGGTRTNGVLTGGTWGAVQFGLDSEQVGALAEERILNFTYNPVNGNPLNVVNTISLTIGDTDVAFGGVVNSDNIILFMDTDVGTAVVGQAIDIRNPTGNLDTDLAGVYRVAEINTNDFLGHRGYHIFKVDGTPQPTMLGGAFVGTVEILSLIHISEPTRPY